MSINQNHRQTLQYAVAQMLMVGFHGTSIDSQHAITQAISKHGLGSVILFDKDLKNPGLRRNIQSPEQVRKLNEDLQSAATHSPLKIPLFIAVDYEGGHVNRLKSDDGFPETLSAEAFAKLSPEAAKIEADRMAETLQQAGFNLNFAPLVDVNTNPKNPIIGKLQRSFSANPDKVAEYAHIVAQALHDHHITFCLKHFPGHGSSQKDSHLDIVDVSKTWSPEEIIPYEKQLQTALKCDMIMSGHIINRQCDPAGLPASLSHTILTGILRDSFEYTGLIIADDLQMKAITDAFGFEESIRMAINAGNDMLIFGNQCGDIEYSAEELIECIMKNIINKKIPEERIMESFERIQLAKASSRINVLIC